MAVTSTDTIPILSLALSEDVLRTAAQDALHVSFHLTDRGDLHGRDLLDRYINCLIGEIAEQAVIAYLVQHGKYAVSAVDKRSTRPDSGHDVSIRFSDGRAGLCSVKFSISFKYPIDGILRYFKPAFKRTEARDINIQVYYYYELSKEPRYTVPSLSHGHIIGWVDGKILKMGAFNNFKGERRTVADMKLQESEAMASLLRLLD